MYVQNFLDRNTKFIRIHLEKSRCEILMKNHEIFEMKLRKSLVFFFYFNSIRVFSFQKNNCFSKLRISIGEKNFQYYTTCEIS